MVDYSAFCLFFNFFYFYLQIMLKTQVSFETKLKSLEKENAALLDSIKVRSVQ